MKKGETDPIWLERLQKPPRSRKAGYVRQILLALEGSQWWDPEDLLRPRVGGVHRPLVHEERDAAEGSNAVDQQKTV